MLVALKRAACLHAQCGLSPPDPKPEPRCAGGGALDINSVRKKPKDWIPDSVWLAVVALSSMDSFRDVADSVFRNDGLWRQWYDQEAPEQAKVRLPCLLAWRALCIAAML